MSVASAAARVTEKVSAPPLTPATITRISTSSAARSSSSSAVDAVATRAAAANDGAGAPSSRSKLLGKKTVERSRTKSRRLRAGLPVIWRTASVTSAHCERRTPRKPERLASAAGGRPRCATNAPASHAVTDTGLGRSSEMQSASSPPIAIASGPVKSNLSPPVGPRPVCAPSSSAAAQSATSRTSIIEIGERANGCEHSSASRRGPATPRKLPIVTSSMNRFGRSTACGRPSSASSASTSRWATYGPPCFISRTCRAVDSLTAYAQPALWAARHSPPSSAACWGELLHATKSRKPEGTDPNASASASASSYAAQRQRTPSCIACAFSASRAST
mmetsp:Transcript_46857/g.156236  ORF Transcript_46857/g.156236 Transcript_46857/m.156236 type:complete len:334 (-) Transcript_46857:211-1212(-)